MAFRLTRLLSTLVLAGMAAFASAQKAPIQITADLTEGARHLYHAEIDFPVKSGKASFITPKWIPGTHAPGGPLADITGVVFTANNVKLQWRRDDVDLYRFHVQFPRGTTSIHAHLDCIAQERKTSNLG